MKHARSGKWSLTKATLMTMALASPIAFAATSTGACPPDLVPLSGPLPNVVASELDALEARRYEVMSSLLDDGTMNLMDELTAEPPFFPIGDALYGDGIDNPLDDPPMSSSGVEAIEVAREIAKQSVGAEITKDVLELTQGATPTLRTLIYLREHSIHRDRWFFSITVEALDGCGASLGSSSEFLPIPDKRGSDESGMYPLDLPLKEITLEIDSIETLEISLYVYWCKSGWFSGHNYGCSDAPKDGSIKVVFV